MGLLNAHDPDKLEQRGFERGEQLGCGSFGYALKVTRTAEPNKGAVYVAKMQKFRHLDAEEQEYLEREIKNMQVIAHPHIVRFRQSFCTENHLCIIMDFCEGGDLAQRIKTQCKLKAFFKESTVVLWLLQLLTALDYLHNEIKAMHRDIKPANVFLHRNCVKLGDLGLSKLVSNGVSKLGSHTQCGSPLYLAPEVHMGEQDHKGMVQYSGSEVDMWAVGCTLFEMMMLEHAFQGATKLDILNAVIAAKYGDIRGKWTPELKDMLEAMLHRIPFSRPKTTELLRANIFQDHLERDIGGINSEGLRHCHEKEKRARLNTRTMA